MEKSRAGYLCCKNEAMTPMQNAAKLRATENSMLKEMIALRNGFKRIWFYLLAQALTHLHDDNHD